MSRNNESQARPEADRKPDEAAPGGLPLSGSEGQNAVTDPALQLERARREVSGKVEQVRRKFRGIMARSAAKIEEAVAAHEAESDYMHDVTKEGDIGILRIMTANQQSEYDVYSGSQRPASTRRLGE